MDVAGDGERALELAFVNDYDLVIVNVMLAGRDGFEVCRELRAAGSAVPVLMLTARDAVEDRVRGLDTGAGGYLTKPFEFDELLAREGSAAQAPGAAPRRHRGRRSLD